MANYRVSILGGQFTYKIEAESPEAARSDAIDEFMEEVQSQTEGHTLNVYEVGFRHDDTTARVLGYDERDAKRNAENYINNKFERAINGSELNDAARDLFQHGFDKGVEVLKELEHEDNYEIDNEGHWNEGQLR